MLYTTFNFLGTTKPPPVRVHLSWNNFALFKSPGLFTPPHTTTYLYPVVISRLQAIIPYQHIMRFNISICYNFTPALSKIRHESNLTIRQDFKKEFKAWTNK